MIDLTIFASTKVPESTLNRYINIATFVVKRYINTDESLEEIQKKYENQIIEIVFQKINSEQQGNIKSKSQGQRNITYGDADGFLITDKIKAMLPVPYCRVW